VVDTTGNSETPHLLVRRQAPELSTGKIRKVVMN